MSKTHFYIVAELKSYAFNLNQRLKPDKKRRIKSKHSAQALCIQAKAYSFRD